MVKEMEATFTNATNPIPTKVFSMLTLHSTLKHSPKPQSLLSPTLKTRGSFSPARILPLQSSKTEKDTSQI